MVQVLLRADIIELAKDGRLLAPFNEDCLRPAGYDIRVGAKVLLACPGEHLEVFLPERPSSRVEIGPGQAALVYSLERLRIPLSLIGHVFIRPSLLARGLTFAGGVLDPGYEGFLFFNVVNIRRDTVELQHGERFATVEFVRLATPVRPPSSRPSVRDEPPASRKPRLPPEGVRDLWDLSTELDSVHEKIEGLESRDRTLVDDDLREIGTRLISPFESDCVKAASYDFRVGPRVVLSLPENHKLTSAPTGHVSKALGPGESYDIPPAHSATIYSLESVDLPLDMQGRLSIRSEWMAKRLNYDGGVIDPGYKGRLFFTVVNLGDSTVEIPYGQPLVTAEFTWLANKASHPFTETPIEEVNQDKLPPPPSGAYYDLVQLSDQLERLERRIDKLEPTRQIMNLFLLAAVAGVLAGVTAVVLPKAAEINLWAGVLLVGFVVGLATMGGLLLGRWR